MRILDQISIIFLSISRCSEDDARLSSIKIQKYVIGQRTSLEDANLEKRSKKDLVLERYLNLIFKYYRGKPSSRA